jgi:uncharacterized protein YlxP (DUF503 family)
MVIGLLSIEIFLPFSHSLKEKRKVLNALRDRFGKKYNIAVAELDFQDKWQRAKLGILTLNSQKRVVDQVLRKILEETERSIEGEILRSEISYL